MPIHILNGRKAILQALKAFGTDVSNIIASNLEKGKMLIPDIRPETYGSAHEYFMDAQAVALVKKNPWILDTDKDATNYAYEKFLKAEEKCKQINMTFSSKLRNDFEFRTVFETARHYAEKILGHEVDLGTLDFGPGATFALRGNMSTLVDKFENLPDVTPIAHDTVLYHILDKLPLYAISSGLVQRDRTSVKLVHRQLPISYGNKLSFVPKSVTEKRVICVEPGGNMLVQKAYGNSIRKRLEKWGLHLGQVIEVTELEAGYRFRNETKCLERQMIHRELARMASIDGSLATIDLSSASDTISIELIRAILPTQWFDALNQVRSVKTQLPDGTWMRNEKFSSMGNGFTFELETLVFYSLCLAVRYHFGKPNDRVSVFGDDMIVSTDWAEQLCSVLTQCGFTVNTNKSFFSGPFRESCGGDYFNGIDVRPIYIKELSNEPIEFQFQLANRLREISLRLGDGVFCDSILLTSWKLAIAGIPSSERLYGPSECGDAVIWNDRLSATGWKRCYTKHHITYVKVRSSKASFKKRARGRDSVLAAGCYGIPSTGVSPRGAAKTYRTQYRAVVDTTAYQLRWR